MTTQQRLEDANHETGPKCKCSECLRLKKQEDKWFTRLGTVNGISGLTLFGPGYLDVIKVPGVGRSAHPM